MNRNLKFMFFMILAMAIWGGSWVCGKIISHDLHFQKLALVRFLLTFVFFIPPVVFLKENLRIGGARAFQIFIGSLFYTLYSQTFFLGLTRGAAGLGGVLVSALIPLMTFFFVSVMSRKRIRLAETAGLCMGLVGSLIILRFWNLDLNSLLLSGNLFFILGAALWSGVTINSQRAQSNVSIWVYSFYLNGFSMLIQMIFVAPYGFTGFLVPDPSFWLYMLYLTLVSAVFATSIYFYATTHIGSHKASAFTFMVPASAMMLSWIFLAEVPEFSTLCGGLLSVGAVYLIQRNP